VFALACLVALVIAAGVIHGGDESSRAKPGRGEGAFETACTRTWTGPTRGGSWSDPANWSPPGVPGERDWACIPRRNSVVIYAGDQIVAGVIDGGALTLVGGSLSLIGTEMESEVADLNITDAVIAGRGPMRVTRSLWWGPRASLMGPGLTLLDDLGIGGSDGCGHAEPALVTESKRLHPQRVARIPPIGTTSTLRTNCPAQATERVRVDRDALPQRVVTGPAPGSAPTPCLPYSPPYIVACSKQDPSAQRAVRAAWSRFWTLLQEGRNTNATRRQLRDLMHPDACVSWGTRVERRHLERHCLAQIDRTRERIRSRSLGPTLRDIVVSGDRARGTPVPPGSGGIHFVKLAGRWRVRTL
jgi:hypothetical protein